MPDWLGIVFLYLLGSVLLIVELFLPAHGLLGLVGLALLIFGVYRTFEASETAGVASLMVLAVVLPTGFYVSIKNWHRTPVGRRISPPNPELKTEDRLPIDDAARFVGRVGRSATPLRPVGMCLFDGRRVECIAEHGMIESNVEVEGVALVDRSLSVRPVSLPSDGTATT